MRFVPAVMRRFLSFGPAFVVLLTIVNLRGVRESGVLFAVPTYGFVAVMFVMIATGIAKCADGSCPQAAVPSPLVAGAGVVATRPIGITMYHFMNRLMRIAAPHAFVMSS